MITTASGLQYEDTVTGSGPAAEAGQQVRVHYTGWLYNNGVKGAKFDSSKDRGDPFEFGLGEGMVIKGWDEGVMGMKTGEIARITCTPDYAYGAGGFPAWGIMPNATLIFEIELLKC